MNVKCFMIEPVARLELSLRRFCFSEAQKCPIIGYHNAVAKYSEIDYPVPGEHEYEPYFEPNRDNKDWPKACQCGYEFLATDQFQVWVERFYKRLDTGELVTRRNAPAGAMWWATWLPKNFYWDNKEDHHLMCKLPDGTEWNIDSRCNNCALPDDRTHRCWGRTGTPPMITAGKIGLNCPAGGGSIASPRYHGFLIDGELRQC